MITILSSPKPFKGFDKVNQYNAINNWKKIKDVEIILYGDEEGIDEAASKFNIKIVREVESSRQGIPLFNSIIAHAEKHSIYNNLMYINCDILINETLLQSLNLIKLNKFLLVGERLDLDKDVKIDLYKKNYKKEIYENIQKNKIYLHGPTGIDYFVFPKGIWDGLPRVVIGRGGYDSSLLAHCKRNKIPIVDGTGLIIALHQFHNYSHIEGGKNKVFYGEDAMINNNSQGGKYSSNFISDAEFYIENNKLIHYKCRGEKLRAVELSLRFNFNMSYCAFFIKIIRKIIKFGPLLPPTVNDRILNDLKNSE